MTTSKTKIAGWVLSLLLALLLGASASSKLTEWEGKAAMFEKMGFTTQLMEKIGVLEILITLVFLSPPTGFVGAILITGYLGGAIVTHLRVGEPIIAPVIIGIVVWIALALRRLEIFSLALGKKLPPA